MPGTRASSTRTTDLPASYVPFNTVAAMGVCLSEQDTALSTIYVNALRCGYRTPLQCTQDLVYRVYP